MKHALTRMLSVPVITGLLAGMAVVPTAAQDASPPPEGLPAVCEANAPDEATLATCLDIVATVLAPAGATVRLVTVPTAEEFYAGMLAVLPPKGNVDAGSLVGQRASTKRTKPPTKKQQQEAAKQEIEAARMYADQSRAYLLSVTPDPCYDNMYASAWGAATALQQWADKALKQAPILLYNTYSQFVESPQAISCQEPAASE